MKEENELEQMNQSLLLKILNAPRSTPKESVYLELGALPVTSIIKSRRLKYLYYLCTLKKDSMLYRFFKIQWLKPSPGDWTYQIKRDMEDISQIS